MFRWDAANQRLAATWDSSRTNTSFFRTLGTVLARSDTFRLKFRIQLDEVRSLGGVGTFQLAAGFLRTREAFAPGFLRGSGVNPTTGPKDLVEFNYFPAGGVIMPTFAAVAIGTNNLRWAMANVFPLELTTGNTFEIEIGFDAERQVLGLTILRDGEPYGAGETTLDSRFGDFRVDAFAITSYSGAGQPAAYGGDLFATGWIDDLEVEYPDPPRPKLAMEGTLGTGRARTRQLDGWSATLERAMDPALSIWEPVPHGVQSEGADWVFQDPAADDNQGFYRARFDRP